MINPIIRACEQRDNTMGLGILAQAEEFSLNYQTSLDQVISWWNDTSFLGDSLVTPGWDEGITWE